MKIRRNRYAWQSFPVALSLLAMAAIPVLAQGADKLDPNKLYVKKGTWEETMLASREKCAGVAALDVTLGTWFATEPIKAQGFSDALFPEQGVDLAAKSPDGKPLWQRHPEWADGQVYGLPGQDSASTYLFRTMAVAQAMPLDVSLGSDDGIVVWLNGASVFSKDVPRGAAPDQDTVTLNLAAGENRLLLKIFNVTGSHAFYFQALSDPAQLVWCPIKRDFPVESGWMMRDLPNGAHLAWFRQQNSAETDKAMIAHVLDAIGGAGEAPRKALDALSQTSPNDKRWLDLYARVCRVRDLQAEIARLDLPALRRALTDLTQSFAERYPAGPKFLGRLDDVEKRLSEAVTAIASGRDAEAGKLVADGDALRREALLANPLIDFDRILLVKRSEGNLGLPQNWQGNCAMTRDGYDNEIAVLSPIVHDAKLTTFFKPEGSKFVGDVDLHFDADKMLFSMPGSNDRWQIWEVKADGSGLRQVTPGEEPDVDNYDACYLPNGRIIFASTRCFQGVPCVGGANTVANFCLMDADGKNIRQLCFDQDHNWCPTVLNNGRVLYTRWEYSDTPHYFSRLLFSMNPDGTNQMEYYGSNSFWPNSTFYARPIPGQATEIVAIISGHHGVPRMGELVLFDPERGRHEGDGVVQRIPGYGKKVEPVIMDTLVDAAWPKFLHPYPLSDKYFLVSCKPTASSLWGIYLVDVFDNMVVLCETPGYALFEPLPFRKTPPAGAAGRPPVVPDRVRLDRQDATVYLADVYQGQGLKGVPLGTVKSLRVYEFHYAYPQMGGHVNIGVEGPWDVHRILGTVPVSEDGSALFKVPANTPIAVQPLDAEGKALQLMRSWFSAMPGEILSCVGCHERQNETAPVRRAAAGLSGPSEITPWHGPARGFSFKRDVQPALDKYCVGCHNGEPDAKGSAAPDLSAKPKNGPGNFTPSYLALHPYVRRPGPESDYRMQIPLEFHGNTSELVQMLRKGHHGVRLDDEAWDRLLTWIDLNVPDHGTWHEQHAIPGDFHERRIEMRTRYANRPEDPEAIPNLPSDPIPFVKPEPEARPKSKDARCPGWPFDAAEAQRKQASAGKDVQLTVDLGDGVTMTFVLIPAGEFVMGDAAGCLDELPPTRTAVKTPFYMGRLEVTSEQYRRFDASHDNGVFDQHNKDHTTRGYPINGPKQPVVRVSWSDAMAFCRWLSEKTGRECALPTEAQWEWACRVGAATPLYYGDLDTDFSPCANLADASIKLLAVAGVNPQPIEKPSAFEDFLPKDARFNDKTKLLADAGSYQPNAWGLCDMHGNVWEWTRSDYRPYPYVEDDGRNGLAKDTEKVVRGGSWFDRPKRARSAFRLPYRPYQGVYNVGFRVVIPAG